MRNEAGRLARGDTLGDIFRLAADFSPKASRQDVIDALVRRAVMATHGAGTIGPRAVCEILLRHPIIRMPVVKDVLRQWRALHAPPRNEMG